MDMTAFEAASTISYSKTQLPQHPPAQKWPSPGEKQAQDVPAVQV